jgi:hypothetical protein
MVLAGLGLGVFFSLLTLAVQNAVPRTMLGVGTGAIRYMQQAGGTLGVAVVGTVVNNTIASDIASRLPAGASRLTPAGIAAATNPQVLVNPTYHSQLVRQAQQYAVHAALQSAQATGKLPTGPGASAAIAAITQQVQQSTLHLLNAVFAALKLSLAVGIEHGLTVIVVVSVGMVILALLLKDVPLRTSHAPAEGVTISPKGTGAEKESSAVSS